MRNSLRYRILRKLYRSKRALINRRGDGVHSPYAFELIRQAFRNPHPFVAFPELAESFMLQSPKLRAAWGDRLVRRRAVAELCFRLVHRSSREGRVLLLAPSASLLPPYLKATGRVDELMHCEVLPDCPPECFEVIVIEDLSDDALNQLSQWLSPLSMSAPESLMLVWHSHNPRLRPLLRCMLRELSPRASFSTLDLEVWVWRQALTPGRYKVYH